MCPLRRGPSLSEASSLSGQGSVPQARNPSTSQLVLCPVLLTVALQSPSPIRRSSRMERLLSATLWWLFWDSLREFCTANQGEILIKVPSVMWKEDSLWRWKQSGKHFPIFKQGQLDLCLLTLSIYKWASVYRSFTIYNNIFTNSEFCLFDWAHLEPNWPVFLIVYRHVSTEGLGGIS